MLQDNYTVAGNAYVIMNIYTNWSETSITVGKTVSNWNAIDWHTTAYASF